MICTNVYLHERMPIKLTSAFLFMYVGRSLKTPCVLLTFTVCKRVFVYGPCVRLEFVFAH